MKIYKLVILKKLGFSKNFLYYILYTWKIVLGIGLFKLSVIIAILALKLYLGYKRMRLDLAELIDIIKENAQVQYRYRESPL